ncbi:MscL family protein [Patescibacteria group bacterium]|nr:MscL family protein [Patescibacteria group bacterium]
MPRLKALKKHARKARAASRGLAATVSNSLLGRQARGFVRFIRKQGIFSLAVGFVLGGKVSQLVSALVADIINPPLGVVLGKVNLRDAVLTLGSVKILWGDFVSNLIDFLIVATVVYIGTVIIQAEPVAKEEK